MRKLHILCEGQTEETIVRETIAPYFDSPGQCHTAFSILNTKRPASGSTFRGGMSKWSKVQHEIRLLLRDSSTTVLTTLFDYYGLPGDVPGMEDRPDGTPYERVSHVERAMAEAVGDPRFIPHLVLHEIETWVLACHEALEIVTDNPQLSGSVKNLLENVDSPELVNDGAATAPSKRLAKLYPRYKKTSDGPDSISLTGLDQIRGRCPHANSWFDSVADRLKN
ncbi:DUF4276 family protein [Nocardiopsis ansamitocini]|uniref:DUF4276 family protein n=1 Tax=Nocardiopsis ansamitocini TaxID=1670832 RepID=A0A9W6P6K0_9ACTN|nr:DUF4276 family protein [Nocardiopsis ansamitocini]GLU47976.1 hypothetical protein Nans01_23270 [Nocardiopsis ansamitocini]